MAEHQDIGPLDDLATSNEARDRDGDVAGATSALPFSLNEVAVIAARIARGETKTEVVRSMPGYATRRHREFVGYYEVIAAALTDAGLLEIPHAVPRP